MKKEQLETIAQVLFELSSRAYNYDNGPWGNECPSCLAQSRNPSEPPPHTEDCEIQAAIKLIDHELVEMDALEDVQGSCAALILSNLFGEIAYQKEIRAVYQEHCDLCHPGEDCPADGSNDNCCVGSHNGQ